MRTLLKLVLVLSLAASALLWGINVVFAGEQVMHVTVLRDDLSWEEVKISKDVEAVKAWLKENPGSCHAQEATQDFWEDLRYAQAAAPTLAACDLYLQEFPSGRYAEAVRRTREDLEWRALAAAQDPEAIRLWVERNPESENVAAARAEWERLRFAQVRKQPSVKTCQLYLREFPGGANAGRVRALLEEAEWRSAAAQGDAGALRRWLARNPASAQVPAARLALDELSFREVKRARTTRACEAYLVEFRNGRHLAEVRAIHGEARAWEMTVRKDTVQEYLRYPDRFPKSGFLSLAKERADPRYWSAAVARDPKSDHALTQFAEACLAAAACPLARVRESYQRAVALNSKNPQALLGLARLSYDSGNYDGARKLLERSLAVNSGIAETHYYLGLLATRRQDCPAAIRHLDRAIALAPDYLEAFFHRGSCKVRVQGCRQALPDFRKVLTLGSEADAKYLRQAQDEIRSCR